MVRWLFYACLQVLRDNTRISYDWSYIVAWAGVTSSLIAAILLSGAAVCLRSEREKEEQLNLQYLMPGRTHQMNMIDLAHHSNLSFSFRAQSIRKSSRHIRIRAIRRRKCIRPVRTTTDRSTVRTTTERNAATHDDDDNMEGGLLNYNNKTNKRKNTHTHCTAYKFVW